MTSFSDLFGGGGGGEIISSEIFTTSGTWTKSVDVLPTDFINVEMWGGGASGACILGSSTARTATGGGGGGYTRFSISASLLSATETVAVGSGGAGVVQTGVNGHLTRNIGGTSSFTINGVERIIATGGQSNAQGGSGFPDFSLVADSDRGGYFTLGLRFYPGGKGGGMSAGSSSVTSVDPPTDSIAGGAGGAAGSTYPSNGTDGGTPAGGGGCGVSDSTTNFTSGSGGNGRVVISVVRGVFLLDDLSSYKDFTI